MRSNELRIGNFIYEPLNENERAFKVFEIYHEEDYDKINYHNALSFEPVPLTEEWLIKFGFIKYDDGGELHGGDCFYISKKNNIAIGLTPKYNLSGYRNVRIEYVHQLQNLYFALTGEELTIPV